MSKEVTFLLVSNASDDYWGQLLEQALSPLGSVQVCREQDTLTLVLQQNFGLIIIDAASVNDASQLVSFILSRQAKAKIVVATASPTWKQARRAFYAGATDYMRKLSDKKEILSTLQAALKKDNSRAKRNLR